MTKINSTGPKFPINSTPGIDTKPGSALSKADKAKTFQASLNESASASQANGVTTEMSTMKADILSGNMSVEQAMNKMIDKAMSSPMTELLDDSQKTQLRDLLKSSLESDPIIAQMSSELRQE